MPPKRSAPSKVSGTEPKRQRKMQTIVEKVQLLDMLKQGRSFAAVGCHYGINESSVRYIKKDEKNIRMTAAVSFNKTAKRVVTSRNKAIVRMESALALWISDCRRKDISLDTNTIRTKAKKLHDSFAESGDDHDGDEEDEDDNAEAGPSSASPTKQTTFSASKGWFDKFQKRFGLRSVPLHGRAASEDKAGAEEYVNNTFKTLIEEGGYRPEQVFNMDETGLFWKRMPSRTFIMKDEAKAPGFKAQKDRVTCFIPEVKLYLAEKGLKFKVVLIMDNAGGHAVDLSYDGVQIEFLPPNTTSLIQLMDQGVIRAFKALYTRSALQNLVDAMDSDEDFSLKAYWLDKAVKLAKRLGGDGFNNMTHEDVNDLIDAHSQPLTDEDLTEMTKSASEEEEEEQEEPGSQEEEEVGLTLERLATMVRMAKDLQRVAQEWDPHMLRSLQFANTIEGGMTVYKNLLAQNKKQHQQLPITMFLTCKKRQVTPTPSAETEVANEGEDTTQPDEAPDAVAPSEEL
uniref:tigger transposable element-derived protein 1-like n=1 Tax=Myxine glutinosa TaxID=7769 RepID=UPI00358E0465